MTRILPSIEPYTNQRSAVGFGLVLAPIVIVITLVAIIVSLLLGGGIPSQQITYKGGDSSMSLYMVDVNRANAVPLYHDTTAVETSLAWSPNALRLVFVTQRDGNQEIYMLSQDGRSVTNLTNNFGNDYAPLWLDNERIIFWSTRESGMRRAYIMDVETGETEAITAAMIANSDGTFVWSPDGSRYASISYRNGKPEIYVRDINETQSERLTDNDSFEYAPAWSPDGNQIAFWSDRDNGQMRLYVMNADGSDEHPITEAFIGRPSFSWSVTWSADGSSLAFIADLDHGKVIYTINADGTNLRRRRLIENSVYPPAITWRP